METEIKKAGELFDQQGTIEQNKSGNNLPIPMAIVIAGVLIAGAVYFSSIESKDEDGTQLNQKQAIDDTSLENVRSVSNTDRIRGNINAPVKIVEYSDTECPFCKRFHATMQQVMDEYSKSGKVAWIYRHSPIDSLHPKARREAEATECANELGGNDKFWAYLDRMYEITPSNNGLDDKELPKIAEYVGLNVADFNSCLESGRHAEYIEKDAENATETGGRGTPWSIVIAKNGKKYPIHGAQPYESVKQIIDLALK